MFAFILAIISGLAMSIQGVFNTRLGEKIGCWETNAIVQGIAFALTLVILFFFRDGDFSELKNANKLYLLGGALGVVITVTVMKSIGSLGTTLGIGVILIAQLTAAALIDAFGLFGTEKVPFTFHQILGVVIMLAGIILFKWKF